MEKLTLDLTSLEVQSFPTIEDGPAGRGTVLGRENTMESCFTFDYDTCDCSNQYETQCCQSEPPTVNMMYCNTSYSTDRYTGDPWNPTCS